MKSSNVQNTFAVSTLLYEFSPEVCGMGMHTELVDFLIQPAVYCLKEILTRIFNSLNPAIKTEESTSISPKKTCKKQTSTLCRVNTMSQEYDDANPNQEFCVVLSLGHEKHTLTVRRGTTVEELANIVFLEVLNEAPPSSGPTLGSAFRLVFRGRQLMTPNVTMGALRVKNGEKIMVLMNQNHRSSPSRTDNSSQSSNATEATVSTSSNQASSYLYQIIITNFVYCD
ncbi:Ubiquitin-related domain [Trinorchestia longiramus]|nr:Ubiquitin-related domain [Trinorchestia longiramus]